MSFPKDIKEQRRLEREDKTTDQRQVAALEDIADVLESIRIILLGMTSAQDQQSGARQP
jgi:hypothetical protein